MIKTLRLLFSLLAPQDRRRVWRLIGVVLAMSVTQVAGIALILPFLQLAKDPSGLGAWPRLAGFADAVGIDSDVGMLRFFGGATLVLLLASSIISVLSLWQRHRLAWTLAHTFSMRLAKTYLGVPYTFHLRVNSAELVKRNSEDVNAVVHGVILAGSQALTSVMLVMLFTILLLSVAPGITAVALAVIVLLFGGLIWARRSFVADLGRRRMTANSDRFMAYSELLAGMKTIRVHGAQSAFLDKFAEASAEFSDLQPRVQFAALAPRFAVESLAFTAIVAAALVMTANPAVLGDRFEILSLFALAGLRFIPAASQGYSALTTMLSHLPAVHRLATDLALPIVAESQQKPMPTMETSVSFHDVRFGYDETEKAALCDVSMTIARGERVGIVGPSGSGKSTLADLLTGVFAPDMGEIRVDGRALTETTRASWQSQVAYVPQDVFIADATLAENIVFGSGDRDDARIWQACDMAQIGTTIRTEFGQGLDTQLGQSGARLSGGQKQRIGLARALYRAPRLLVLDEATSALDSMTEALVSDSIHTNLPDIAVVLVAHRISTVRACNRLFVLDRGQIVETGTYDELMAKDGTFRDLARFA